MIFQFLSETVFAFHLLVTVYTLFGIAMVWRWPRQAWFHVPIVLWMVCVNLAGGFCPLTFLEEWLRSASSIPGYNSSLIEQFIVSLIDQYIYPIDPARTDLRRSSVIWAPIFSVVNGVGYSMFVWHLAFAARSTNARPLSGDRLLLSLIL